jgi:23S rRNA pseudouridine955/2504/2580 synthase/23S rRNA pseudouridine1911/1915/1917 synthase
MAQMLDILWQDDDLIAVCKPAGIATVPGRDGIQSVRDFVKTPQPLRMIHRLDKDTSGVLLMAKSSAAQRNLCEQFLTRKVEKEYWSLVAGYPPADSGTINAPIGPHPTTPKYMMIRKQGGKPAVTKWEVLERYRGLTLLRCLPLTGRTHQIRVHLKSIGLPLAIDPLYHQTVGILLSHFKRDYQHKDRSEKPLIDRLTLHAMKLKFCDLKGAEVSVECPPPKDFRATVNMMRKYGRR